MLFKFGVNFKYRKEHGSAQKWVLAVKNDGRTPENNTCSTCIISENLVCVSKQTHSTKQNVEKGMKLFPYNIQMQSFDERD
jgi:hypothetical protein